MKRPKTTILKRRAYRAYFDRPEEDGPFSVLVLADTFERALQMMGDAFPGRGLSMLTAEKHSYFDEKKLEPEVILI